MTRKELELRKALRNLIKRADDMEAAMAGVTDQFEDELSRLSRAASMAEKALDGAA